MPEVTREKYELIQVMPSDGAKVVHGNCDGTVPSFHAIDVDYVGLARVTLVSIDSETGDITKKGGGTKIVSVMMDLGFADFEEGFTATYAGILLRRYQQWITDQFLEDLATILPVSEREKLSHPLSIEIDGIIHQPGAVGGV
jgi:hypothetical protein